MGGQHFLNNAVAFGFFSGTFFFILKLKSSSSLLSLFSFFFLYFIYLLQNMKALITGITGQDGSYLAELLLEKGYEVSLVGEVRANGCLASVL